jgi:hypothetical protein
MSHTTVPDTGAIVPVSPRPPPAAPQPATVPAPLPGVLLSPIPFLTEREVALATEAALYLERIRRIALEATRDDDWIDIGGRPHLNSSGAMKVAALFGVSLTGMRVDETREKLDGKDVIRYAARVTARFLGREVETEGVASSDDAFFARKNGKPVPLHEVNLNSVRKKAVTNAQVRAVKGILGLGGITWAEVRAAGVSREKVAAVRHGSVRDGAVREGCFHEAVSAGAPPRKQAPSATAAVPASSRAKARLRSVLEDIAAFEDVPFERVLRRYSEFVGSDGQHRSAESVESMSESWVARSLEAAERDWRSVPAKAGAKKAAAPGR